MCDRNYMFGDKSTFGSSWSKCPGSECGIVMDCLEFGF